MRNRWLTLPALLAAFFTFPAFKSDLTQAGAVEKNNHVSVKKDDFILGYIDQDGYTVYFHGNPDNGTITYIEVFNTVDMSPVTPTSYHFVGSRNPVGSAGWHVSGYFSINNLKHFVDADINGF